MSGTTPRKRTPAKRTTKAAALQQSQRERLLGRPRPSLPHRILMDHDQVDPARAELAKVQREARQVQVRANATAAQKAAAQSRVVDAEATVEACYETIVLRALPPRRVEQLETEHPPTEQQMAKVRSDRERAQQRGEELPEWPQYNEDTFWPALLAESADGDMTVEDWSGFLAEHVSSGELVGLRMAALQVQHAERSADPVVLPKGLMQTLSSRLS